MSSEAELTLVMKARNLASREVDRLHGSLLRVHGTVGRLGGALVTLSKVGILGIITAIGTAIGFLGLASRAAENEQVATAKLNTALRDSHAALKGQAAAIDKGQARMVALGFTTVEYRTSLARLVLETHNVARAQRLQTVAADLARLKGISLTDASLLLVKAQEGNKRVLKELGISVDKHATKQQILAAIIKQTAGQAEAYGHTAAGAQAEFGAAVDELVTNLGAGLMPVITAVMTFLTTKGIPAVRGVIGAISKWMAENKPLIDQIRDTLVKVIGMAVDKIHGVVTWLGNVFAAISANKDVMNVLRAAFAAIATAAGLAFAAISTVVTWVGEVFAVVTKDQRVISGFATVWNALGKAVNIVVDAFRWLLDNAGKVIDTLSHLKLPDVTGITNLIPHFAAGGTVPGRRGEPTLMVGHGGEHITAPGPGTADRPGPGFTIRGVSERELVDMVDRGLYFRLQRAAPTLGRT